MRKNLDDSKNNKIKKEKQSKEKSDKEIDYVKEKYGNYLFKIPHKDENYTPKDFIHSGSYFLNYNITGQMLCGVPRRKMIEFFGLESVGKTSLALAVAKEATTKKLKVLYGDFERGLNEYYAKNMNIDRDYFHYFKPDNGEQGFDLAEELLKKFDYDLFIVDSVGAAKTRKQMEGDYSNATMGVQASLFSKVATRFSRLIDKKNVAMILINQLSSTIGTYGKSEDTKGGRTLKYYEWCRIQLKTLRANKIIAKTNNLENVIDNKSEDEDDEKGNKSKEEIGILVSTNTIKNKLYKPRLSCDIKLIYGFGFDVVWDFSNFLDVKGVCKSNKERTKLKYKNKTYNAEVFYKLFNEREDLKKEILEQIK